MDNSSQLCYDAVISYWGEMKMGRIYLLAVVLLASICYALPAFAGDHKCEATKDAYYLGDCAWLPCEPTCVRPLGECPKPAPCPCPEQPCACPPCDCCDMPGVHCTDDCTPIPVVEPYCPELDPNCPPHLDYCLVCCERSPYQMLCCQEREQFKLICQPKCEPCPKPKKCKQHTCTPANDCNSCDGC